MRLPAGNRTPGGRGGVSARTALVLTALVVAGLLMTGVLVTTTTGTAGQGPAPTAAPTTPMQGGGTTAPLPRSAATSRSSGSNDDVPAGQGAAVAREPAAAPDGGVRSAAALPGGWPKGVDVSSWQHPSNKVISWSAVKNAGMSFAIIKATENNNYTNDYFAADRYNAIAAGLVVGAYHYARPAWPTSTAVDQANYFLSVIGSTRGSGQLAPILDLETTGGLSAAQLGAWTSAFMETIETRTGRAPILYTYRSFWTDQMGNTTFFAGYPLWFAIYNGQDNPGGLPGGWPNWAMWQFTSSATVAGISTLADQSVVCCSSAALTSIADGRDSELWKQYARNPYVRLALGGATRAEAPAGGGGRWQAFYNGLMVWSVRSGAHEVHGGIGKKYLAMGGTNCILGRPVSDEQGAGAAGTRQSIFQNGRIIWSNPTGAREVRGGILTRYLQLGGTSSWLGMPTSDEYSVPGGRRNNFQHGYLTWNAKTNVVS